MKIEAVPKNRRQCRSWPARLLCHIRRRFALYRARSACVDDVWKQEEWNRTCFNL